jgi:hypothetical protein
MTHKNVDDSFFVKIAAIIEPSDSIVQCHNLFLSVVVIRPISCMIIIKHAESMRNSIASSYFFLLENYFYLLKSDKFFPLSFLKGCPNE